jgi:Spy/CpxP family protein refolding chaperone
LALGAITEPRVDSARATAGPAHRADAEQQLKVLTEKLDLTGDQQARIKPILQQSHDATEKLVEDKNLSPEERLDKVRAQRYKTDKQIRELLNDDQKKKLDRFEQEPHPEMHGNLTGAISSTPELKREA